MRHREPRGVQRTSDCQTTVAMELTRSNTTPESFLTMPVAWFPKDNRVWKAEWAAQSEGRGRSVGECHVSVTAGLYHPAHSVPPGLSLILPLNEIIWEKSSLESLVAPWPWYSAHLLFVPNLRADSGWGQRTFEIPPMMIKHLAQKSCLIQCKDFCFSEICACLVYFKFFAS